MASNRKLTHVDDRGAVRMVDVGEKPVTTRRAVASGRLRLGAQAIKALQDNTLKKGDALAAARLAGIQAAKKTSEWIPLCHPLPLTHVRVDLETDPKAGEIRITAEVRTNGPTGVEMEALTAVAGAALTLYDMLKAVDKSIVIENILLLEKEGGRSGTYRRAEADRSGRSGNTVAPARKGPRR